MSHAGPQPLDIAAAPDQVKAARGKFIAPEKKTGVPSARAPKVAKNTAKKSVPQKTTKVLAKRASIKRRKSA